VEATVLELPTVADIARRHVAAAGLASRIEVVAGDAMAGALPPGYDVFLLANLIHYSSPEGNRALLQRVRGVAEATSHLLLADFWTNSTHTEPLQAALMAGEFAVHLRDGDVYSVDEARGWAVRNGLAIHRARVARRSAESDCRRGRLSARTRPHRHLHRVECGDHLWGTSLVVLEVAMERSYGAAGR
jgi:hypothetical protein